MNHCTLQINHLSRRLTVAGLLILLTAAYGGRLYGQEAAPAPGARETILVSEGLENGQLKLVTGKSAMLNTSRPFKRVSISDGEIAVAKPLTATTLLVIPKKAGVTQLILWDEQDRSQAIDITVQPDLQVLQEQLKKLFPDSKIDASNANGTTVLSGRVSSAQIAEQAAQVAVPFGTKVLNLLEVSGGQQVMLQVRFAEVSRSAASALGVNFGYTDGRSFAGNNVGQVDPLGIKEIAGNAVDLAVTSPNPAVTLFGKAVMGDTALAYFVTAMRQNNLLRILAEPNLIAASGQEASFLAGGEFPIPVTQSGGASGGSSITIEYREFGVRLTFVPVVLGDGRIRLKVAPEVSDLDFTTAVRFNGFVVPGLTSRKVQTTIELTEGQTFAIAGLLNNNVTANKDVTPLLGDLPVVGALFRSVRYQRKETELVVLVTPRLVAGMNPAQVGQLPGEKWRHPSENDLFLKGDIGGPAAGPGPTTAPSRAGEAPRFYGEYGFTPVTQSSAGQ